MWSNLNKIRHSELDWHECMIFLNVLKFYSFIKRKATFSRERQHFQEKV